jgi:hypothetical protein
MYVTTVETWGDNDFILIVRAREWLNDVDYHDHVLIVPHRVPLRALYTCIIREF